MTTYEAPGSLGTRAGGAGTRRRPDIVVAVEVGQPLVRIEVDAVQRLPPEGVGAQVAPGIRAPHFSRVVEVFRGAVTEREAGVDGQHAARMVAILHHDALDVPAARCRDCVDRLIEVRVLPEPFAPEP